MIDIHTHILPGLDDGAERMEDAIFMARTAWAEGITDIIATPHHANGNYTNYGTEIIESVHQLQKRLHSEGIPVTLHAGQEIRVHDDLLDALARGELLTLGSSSYILLEMPSHKVPSSMPGLIHELSIMGLRPIIAHPERNLGVTGNPDLLAELIDNGAYTQVTTSSLLGGFGERVQKAAWSLCKKDLIHLVSSDAHNVSRRSFRLQEAYSRIESELGSSWVECFKSNASCIIENTDSIVLPTATKEPNFLLKITSFFRK